MLHFVVILYLIFMSPMLAHAAMCGAGYYLADDDTCKICNISQGPPHASSYCPGDDMRYPCPDISISVNDVSDAIAIYAGPWLTLGSLTVSAPEQCNISVHIETVSGIYSLTCQWQNGSYYKDCDTTNSKWYYSAKSGYYLSRWAFTNSNGVWYLGTKSCTNAPLNATYTGSGTPDSPDGAVVDANDCPRKCNAGYGRTVNNTCLPLCTLGFTSLRTTTGIVVPVFTQKNTSPSLHFVKDGNVCYVDLVPGETTGAIHIVYNGVIYHTMK